MSDVQLTVVGGGTVGLEVIDGVIPQLTLTVPSMVTIDVAVPGIQGPAGTGVPVGGTTGQVLSKINNSDYNTQWSNPAVDWSNVSNKPATIEYTTNKNQSNGYAGLDGSGKVAAAQLPSYVDDVLEYANSAAFPGTGETGKIYVALDTNKIYRWSGSTYIEISPSPGSTDSVPEGSSNLYFTTARASAAAPVQSVAGKTGVVTLAKGDVGLGNVENTALSTWAGSTSITTLGTISTGTVPAANVSGLAASATTNALNATNISSGTLNSARLPSVNLGTTSVDLTRASGSLSLTGISIDGNAGTVTNGIYTTGSYSDPSWLTISKSKVGLGNVPNTDCTNASNIASGTLNAARLPSVNIGTTSVDLTRASGNQALTGISSLSIPASGSAPATPSGGFTFYANSTSALSWKGANGFVRTFDGTSNTADRTYTLPDASGTLVLAGSNGMLPAGGTTNQVLAKSSNADYATQWVTPSAGTTVNYQEFTSSGTWTKPAGCTVVYVEVIGAGGGGGSGARYATTSARSGGGSGASGTSLSNLFAASSLSSTISVTVGVGGTGGTAITTDSTNGNDGNSGGSSSFGTYLDTLTAGGGKAGNNSPNALAGTASIKAAFVGTPTANVNGSNGVIGSTTAPGSGTGSNFSGSGGGGAGRAANTTTSLTGGSGGIARNLATSATGAAAGANATANEGGGGGGGSYTTAQVGQAGGNGASPGGGGGGGSASDNWYNSGAGGNGGNGLVRVWAW